MGYILKYTRDEGRGVLWHNPNPSLKELVLIFQEGGRVVSLNQEGWIIMFVCLLKGPRGLARNWVWGGGVSHRLKWSGSPLHAVAEE
jgi:hypothetical protein